MSDRSSFSVPTYRRHRQSGQAVVTLRDAVTGRRRDVLLGPHGTSDSRKAYAELIDRWEAAGRRLAGCALGQRRGDEPQADLTVNELLLQYWRFCQEHYRNAAGARTSEADNIRQAIRPLKELFGHTSAAAFGPLNLKAVRQKIVEAGICRTQVNGRVNRIRRAFKWAVENELVPPGILQGLQAVAGLQRGRTDAPDREPVRPVPLARVEATLPFLPPAIAALVRLQLLTAARPGELLAMRSCDLDVTGNVWVYRPPAHKTRHHGKTREIWLGPQAQAVVREWLKPDLQAYLFTPADTMRAMAEERRRSRATPLWPSHLKAQAKRKRARESRLADRYSTVTYGQAICRACDSAFPPPDHLARREGETLREWDARLSPAERVELKAWRRSNRWHPHQLRHTAATELRKRHGIEMARIILGHSTAFTTEIYAESDRQAAAEVIAKIG